MSWIIQMYGWSTSNNIDLNLIEPNEKDGKFVSQYKFIIIVYILYWFDGLNLSLKFSNNIVRLIKNASF